MAYKITDFNQFNPVNGSYPYGDIKDDDGTFDGTDVNRKNYADIFQFFAKLSDYAGVALNSLPDNATNGFQFFNALIGTIKKLWITDIGKYNGSGGDITTTSTAYIT